MVRNVSLKNKTIMDEYRKEQIEALQKAAELCEKGGCMAAIPYINRRIHWLNDNCNFYD
jgi:hypothetical protein